jgi:hypothetical protein
MAREQYPADLEQCSSCQDATFLNRATNFFATVWGEIMTRVSHPYYSDLIAPGFGQPHKVRDGQPWTGLLPTIQIDAPTRPELELNPVTSTTWFLRAVGRDITPPRRQTIVPYSRNSARAGHWGNSGG